MLYLLKDPKDSYYALVSHTGAADGWYSSLDSLNLTLPYKYYHNRASNVLETINRYGHIILSTYTDIDHFKFEHPELFI